jgi:hypothetical protein
MGQALSRDCPREARTLAARALSAASSSAVSALSRCSFGRDEAFVFNFSTRESSADDLADDAVICLPSWRDSSLSIKCTTPVNISPQYRRHSPLDCHSAIFAAFPVSVYPEPPEASGYWEFCSDDYCCLVLGAASGFGFCSFWASSVHGGTTPMKRA